MISKKKIIIPIYKYKLTIVIFDSWDEIKSLLKDYISNDEEEASAVTISQYGASLVAVNAKRGSSIVHESYHVMNNIWRFIEYNPDRDNNEVSAYLLTYIYEKIVDVFYKHPRKEGATT